MKKNWEFAGLMCLENISGIFRIKILFYQKDIKMKFLFVALGGAVVLRHFQHFRWNLIIFLQKNNMRQAVPMFY